MGKPLAGGNMNNDPSPGNKLGGLTTALEMPFGAAAKGGTSLKLATNSVMYATIEEGMDIYCSDILDGTTIAEKGRINFRALIDTASGERTKSELPGHGGNAFVLRQICAVT
jgi:altronate dehydratase